MLLFFNICVKMNLVMKMDKELPKRKHPRLKKYDYSSAGAYFLTICTQNRKCLLSRIENLNDASVGRGLAPAVHFASHDDNKDAFVGRGLARNPQSSASSLRETPSAPAVIKGIEYTKYGKIAEEQLLLLEERYPYLKIDRYVVMPNHIHAVFILGNRTAGASPRPTVVDIVCAYKSLTTRECKKFGLTNNLFQTSFYEHVIRDQKDYEKIVKYIHENPARWYFDELYSE